MAVFSREKSPDSVNTLGGSTAKRKTQHVVFWIEGYGARASIVKTFFV
jgi:hypothetical protein